MAEVDRTARGVEVVFELQGVGVVQTDLKTGRFRRANATFCKLLGYSEAELQELTYLDLTHPDDRGRDAANFEALRQGEQLAGSSVTRCLRKDGRVMWLELHVTVITDETGEKLNLAVAHDITARAHAEAALRDSEANLRAMFEISHVGQAQADGETRRFTRVNPALCAMTGYAEAELLTMTVDDLNHPDDRRRDAERYERLKRGHEDGYDLEKRYRRKDGSTLWVYASGNLIRDAQGRPLRSFAVIQDITARKQAEAERERLFRELKALTETLEQRVAERTEALRASEQRFSRAFHAGPVATCITSLGRETFLEINDSFLELTGYTREAVLGKDVFELNMWSSSEDQEKLGQETGSFRNLELHLRTRTGALRTILLSREFIQLDGQKQGQLKLFYDITESKRTEEELYGAIQEVMSDTAWFSQQVLERLAHIRAGRPDAKPSVELTQRERQVLSHLAQGRSNEVIAKELGLAQQTVRNYISTVYDKLGVKSRAEAVVWARERGIT